MHIESERLIIRDFKHEDLEDLKRIVWQKNVVKFMKDWSENSLVPGRMSGYIDWLALQKDSKDVYENKRYAVVLKENNKLIGMTGMGLEEMTNEVEMAYFIDEEYRGNGYAAEALKSLFKWCTEVSDIPYMILTIDCANKASQRVAEKCGFELFEKRTPISHKQPNMVSDSYFYYRKYR